MSTHITDSLRASTFALKGETRRKVADILANLTGVTRFTAYRWMRGDMTPRGLHYFQVSCWLAEHGNAPTGYHIPQGQARVLFRMLGYGKITPEQARQGARFRTISSVYRYARGFPISNYRRDMLQKVIAEHLKAIHPLHLARITGS